MKNGPIIVAIKNEKINTNKVDFNIFIYPFF